MLPTRLPVCLSLCVGLLACGSVQAQGVSHLRSSSLPTTPVTSPSSSPSVPAVSAPPAPLVPAKRPPQRAEVTFAQGQLTVQAENSSLNQILREISRETGIKISGGVADERVFGKYGPSPASEVLAALLDGTGSNLLLIQAENNAPGELILTPRQGGVTPPNPNAPSFDDEAAPEDPAPSSGFQPRRSAPAPVLAEPTAPAATAPGAAAPAGPETAPAAPTTTDPADPNAVKTPQQIFDQLQRMRQQQNPAPPQ